MSLQPTLKSLAILVITINTFEDEMLEIPADKNNFKIKVTLLVAALSVVLVTTVFLLSQPKKTLDSMAVIEVREGALTSQVKTYGKLKAKVRNSLIALSSGNVGDILLRPGAKVSKGDVIVKLVNPKLKKEFQNAKLLLLEEQSSFNALKVKLEQQHWQQEALIAIEESRLKIVKADLSAKRKLNESNIISSLELQKALMEFEGQTLKIKLEKNKLLSLSKIHTSSLEAASYKAERVKTQVDMLSQELDNMDVKASMSGILLRMDSGLEIGQRIDEGTVLGMVVDYESLYGELVVSASDSDKIEINQQVNVNIKGKLARSNIVRISPTVLEGQVELDVEFIDDLPSSALPNTDVTGEILVTDSQTTLVANRPDNIATAFSTHQVHIKSDDNQDYQLRSLRIGALSKGKMEILSGANAGDELLFNIPEDMKNLPVISLD